MKLLLKIVLGILLLLVVLLVVGVFFIDKVIRLSVEKSGTYALGVETTLEEADFGFFAGSLDLVGLTVANPEGFEREYFFEMGSAALEVSPGSFGGDVINVPLLELADIALDVERSSAGTNYGIILDNLQRFESDDEPGGDPGDEPAPGDEDEAGEGKKFTIGKISLKNITVSVNLLPEGGELTKQQLEIPGLELLDVGTAEGGATATEIASELVTALLEATIEYGEGKIPAEFLQDLAGRLEGFEAKAKAAMGNLEERAEELESKAEGVLKGATEKLEGELGKGLGGLLDRKKDDDG